MTLTTYNTISYVIGSGLIIALALMLVSLVGMIVRWKTQKRRGHVMRLLGSTAAIVCLAGIQYGVLFGAYLPSLGRRVREEANAVSAAKIHESSIVHVRDPAPSFSLTTADGKEFSIANASGEVVTIAFFATWCGPCKIALPDIDQIWKDHRENDHFHLLAIGREESDDSVRQYRKENGYSFPVAADPDAEVYSLFAEKLIPRFVVISPDSTIVYSYAGADEDALFRLRTLVEKQLATLPAATNPKR